MKDDNILEKHVEKVSHVPTRILENEWSYLSWDRKFLSMQALSAKCERTFPIGGHIYSLLRHGVLDSLIFVD